MEDQDIIALYWAREEDAIRETAAKYGGLCRSIVGRILASPEDGEECVNDTWLGLWKEERRTVFLLRYWHFLTIEDICRRTGYGESRVKSMLSRTRQKLRRHLEQEGIEL